MPRMRLVLGALSAVAVFAAGCGGVERERNLAEALANTEAAGTSRIEIRFTEVVPAQSNEVVCEGVGDYGKRRLRLDCGADYGELIAIGETMYFRGSGLGIVGAEGWVAIPDEGRSATQLDPVALLAMLRSASRQTERLGEESLRGVPVVTYRLTVECGGAELSCDGETPIDVSIGEDGLVRRIALEDDEARGTVEFYDFGVEVDIQPPPSDQIQKMDGVYKPQPCAVGEATPISVETAVAVLRKHGFGVRQDEFGCSSSVAAHVSNFDSGEDEWLSCFVLTTAGADGAVLVVGEAVPGGSARPPVERKLENLQCSLFADRQAGEAVRRLDSAFAELKRATRP